MGSFVADGQTIGNHSVPEALNTGYRTIDHASQGGAVVRRAFLPQALLRLLGRKPGAIPIGLLRRVEPRDFTEMSADIQFNRRPPLVARLATTITGKTGFFYPAMHPGLLESFQGSRLGVGQSRFGAALGKSPAPAAGLNQQKFDDPTSHPIANGSHLFASPQSTKVRQSYEPG